MTEVITIVIISIVAMIARTTSKHDPKMTQLYNLLIGLQFVHKSIMPMWAQPKWSPWNFQKQIKHRPHKLEVAVWGC